MSLEKLVSNKHGRRRLKYRAYVLPVVAVLPSLLLGRVLISTRGKKILDFLLMETRTFHRKPLPEPSLSLSSLQGRTLLKEAMHDGTAENFIELCQVWSTQNEPAFCGLATLTSILNACAMDPGQTWKGIWRWYVDEMLDCCRPLEQVKQRGITLEEFACLAKCNGLAVQLFRASESSIETFRHHLSIICSSSDSSRYLAVSYSRKVLGQAGDGHFSPIAAYHEPSNSALILDVARFKYPPHWISVPLLFEAMMSIDNSTDKTRGFTILSKPDGLHRKPLLGSWMCDRGACNEGNTQESILHTPYDKNSWKELFDGLTVQLVKETSPSLSAFVISIQKLFNRSLVRQSTDDNIRKQTLVLEIRTHPLFEQVKLLSRESDFDAAILTVIVICLAKTFRMAASGCEGVCPSSLPLQWKNYFDDFDNYTVSTQSSIYQEIVFLEMQMEALTKCCMDEVIQ